MKLLHDIADFLTSLLDREAARFVAYGSALAVAAALKLADLAGITLTPDLIGLVAVIAAAVVTEVIRRLVYSRGSTQKIANAATFEEPGTIVDIGTPPEGNP